MSGTNMTGRPGYRTMEMIGGSSASHLARTPCVPLFCTLFHRGGNRRAFRLPGENFIAFLGPRFGRMELAPNLNKLKTTPTPNKNGSYGIKGGGGGWYAIKVGVRMP